MGVGGFMGKVGEGVLDPPAEGGTGIAGDFGLADLLVVVTAVPPEAVGTRGEVIGEDTGAGGSLSGSLKGALGRPVIECTCALRDSGLVEKLTLATAVPPKTTGTREV